MSDWWMIIAAPIGGYFLHKLSEKFTDATIGNFEYDKKKKAWRKL